MKKIELKAQVYDIMAQIQYLQNMSAQLNQQIANMPDAAEDETAESIDSI